MDNQVKVYNIFNAPKGKDSNPGEEIYEWEYLDEKGELQKDKKNVKEEINSFVSRVDYKKQIERGELELDGNSMGMVSNDYTRVPDNTVDYLLFLRNLAAMDQEQVAKLLESVGQRSQNDVQTKQAEDKISNIGGETPRKVNGDKSETGTNPTNDNAGGTK